MSMLTRRSLTFSVLAVPFAQSALAQTAPSNITRIVVPFPPGGTVDPIARMLQPGLQQRLGTIERFGDPRDPKVDPVDWVERIPFMETRNYVQRVIENLQGYRGGFGNNAPLTIEADLRRGAK